jgi:hypothetical protein
MITLPWWLYVGTLMLAALIGGVAGITHFAVRMVDREREAKWRRP